MFKVQNHIYQKDDAKRFREACVGLFDALPTNKSVKKAIKRGELRLNDEIVEEGRRVLRGDEISLWTKERSQQKVYPLNIEVLFQDEFLAIVYKPAGLIVSGNQFRTLKNALGNTVTPSSEADALFEVLPVHRLDVATQGLVLVAKTKMAHAHLSQQFADRKIEKSYYALVMGSLEGEGEITLAVDGKKAHSSYKALKSQSAIKHSVYTLVQLTPHTGRTHQLRIHMAHIGHPIVGDTLYGEPGNILLHKGLFLMAAKLKFIHPKSLEPICFEMDLPHKFKKRMHMIEFK